MLYIVSFILFITQITLVPQIHLWGGTFLMLPALILISASLGNWLHWFGLLSALGLSLFFSPFPAAGLAALLLLSIVAHIGFQRWIDQSNVWLMTAVMIVLLLLFSVSLSYPYGFHLLTVLGGVIPVLPIVWFTYVFVVRRRNN